MTPLVSAGAVSLSRVDQRDATCMWPYHHEHTFSHVSWSTNLICKFLLNTDCFKYAGYYRRDDTKTDTPIWILYGFLCLLESFDSKCHHRGTVKIECTRTALEASEVRGHHQVDLIRRAVV